MTGSMCATSRCSQNAAYAVKLAESLLADKPLVSRAAVESYARAKAAMPNEDETMMIGLVSRPK